MARHHENFCLIKRREALTRTRLARVKRRHGTMTLSAVLNYRGGEIISCTE